MKELLNEWRKFLNENEDERYYIRKMEPVSYEEASDLIKTSSPLEAPEGREFYKIEMSDGEILVGEYDPAEQDMRVYDENDEEAGEEYDREALRYLNQDAPYDQERFPEDEEKEKERQRQLDFSRRMEKEYYQSGMYSGD